MRRLKFNFHVIDFYSTAKTKFGNLSLYSTNFQKLKFLMQIRKLDFQIIICKHLIMVQKQQSLLNRIKLLLCC